MARAHGPLWVQRPESKAFCKAEGVSETMFYRWRHRLQDDDPAQAAGFIALPSEAGGGALQSKTAPWELRLELGDGLVLHLARR